MESANLPLSHASINRVADAPQQGSTCFRGGSGGWKRMSPACSTVSGAVTSTLQHKQKGC